MLTKQDLKEIEKISSRQTEELAVMVGKSFNLVFDKLTEHDKRFENIDKRFENIDKRFENIDKRFDINDASHRSINARLDLIETDLSNLRNLVYEVQELRRMLSSVATKEEVRFVDKRLLRVEKHLGFVKA